MPVAAYLCSRCNGSGRLPQHSNVLAGVCFKCNGTGKQLRKPAPPIFQWAVFFFDAECGQMKHAYNFTGRTEREAVKKALITLDKSPQGYKGRFDKNKFFACHVSEVEVSEEGVVPINGFPKGF